jgi:hypothetical protein
MSADQTSNCYTSEVSRSTTVYNQLSRFCADLGATSMTFFLCELTTGLIFFCYRDADAEPFLLIMLITHSFSSGVSKLAKDIPFLLHSSRAVNHFILKLLKKLLLASSLIKSCFNCMLTFSVEIV